MLIGAEAVLTKDGDNILKERIPKGYRQKDLDKKLRKFRTRTEAKLLREAKRIGVNTPSIVEESDFSIKMNFIEGDKVKDIFNNNYEELSKKIGEVISKLHNADIVHGDLTTSNMILKNNDLFLIDFGLGGFSKKIEDKAMDLYLLKEALESTHYDVLEKSWKIILKNYIFKDADKAIKTLSKIEKRGRYNKER